MDGVTDLRPEFRLVGAEGGKSKTFIVATGKARHIELRTNKAMSLAELFRLIDRARSWSEHG